jgi:hypothetical protein
MARVRFSPSHCEAEAYFTNEVFFLADAAAFCKCICGSESQIISLNPPEDATDGSSSSSSSSSTDGLARRFLDSISSTLDVRRMRRRADDDQDDDKSDDDKSDKDDAKDSTKRQKTCADCNRQFCLDYNLPKCKTLPAEEVTTDCFSKWMDGLRGDLPARRVGNMLIDRLIERDSSKDQAVVLIFIAATVSLLGWALLRPWVGKFLEVCVSPAVVEWITRCM